MSHGNPRERLEELIDSLGVPLASLTPQVGLELMLRIYSENPTDRELTCSWGTVTRYRQEELGFDISLWFSDPPADPSVPTPPALSLIFKVGPPDIAGDFARWWECCADLARLDLFRTTIESSPAFDAWGRSSPAAVALVYDDSVWWPHALFDCWGVRDPSRPVVSMTEAEWLYSDDTSLMLRWFRQEWRGEEVDLDRLLQRYCLACCRRVWSLLSQEESRAGVEVAERYTDDRATKDELGQAVWSAEGAAFVLDQKEQPEPIPRWCDEVARIPRAELDAMIHSPQPEDDPSPLSLLQDAAFFAVFAMCYPGIKSKEPIERYKRFLPATLLREVVGNPF